jgi:hypothetical protein
MNSISRLKAAAKETATAAPVKKKAPGRPAGKPAAPRKPLPKFKAPADFRPAFYQVLIGFGKDGLIDPRSVKVIRIQGKIDNPDAKRSDLAEFDQTTILGVVARLSAVLFMPSLEKRLELFPAGSKFRITIRVSKRAADGSLGVSVKMIHRLSSENKWRLIQDKADPAYRRIRRVARIMPSGFIAAQLPPKGVRKKKEAEDDAPVSSRTRQAANDEDAPRRIRRAA